MNKYRVFSARWWNDARCTVPIEMPRRKITVAYVESEDAARAMCREHNFDEAGERVLRAYGSAYEFEQV
jgi:hypothetical protein